MKVLATLLSVLILTACAEPSKTPARVPNTDPRNGEVELRMDGCILGRHCFYDYKMCVGSDLLIVIDAYADRPNRHWQKNSKECAQ